MQSTKAAAVATAHDPTMHFGALAWILLQPTRFCCLQMQFAEEREQKVIQVKIVITNAISVFHFLQKSSNMGLLFWKVIVI